MAGIGLTLMSRIYRTDDRRFATRFNFGDHLALGFDFGAQREHDLALRLEHFSNGGIKHPNPARTSFRSATACASSERGTGLSGLSQPAQQAFREHHAQAGRRHPP